MPNQRVALRPSANPKPIWCRSVLFDRIPQSAVVTSLCRTFSSDAVVSMPENGPLIEGGLLFLSVRACVRLLIEGAIIRRWASDRGNTVFCWMWKIKANSRKF